MQRTNFVLFLTAAALAASTAHGENWPRFRGPNGAGVSNAKSIPVEWTADDYNWVAELPGEGHSSPVVWGERLFVTSADVDAGKRYLLCLDTADGRELWRQAFQFKHRAGFECRYIEAVRLGSGL